MGTSSDHRQDVGTRGIVNVDSEHWWIHAGRGFSFNKYYATLGAGATYYHYIKCNDQEVHARSISYAIEDGPADVFIYEAPTVTADGTPITPINQNRKFGNGSGILMYEAPTVSVAGTLLSQGFLPAAGGPPGHSAGLSGGLYIPVEYVLEPSETYLYAITNNNASAIAFSFSTFWYEP